MTPLSILELVRVTQETDARGALNNARDLAAHAERWGYRRFWVAEHHNMAGHRQRRDFGRDRPYRRRDARPSGSAPAASCCPTMRPMSSPSSSERWRGSFPAASISASAARPAPTSSRCARCAARRRPPRPSRRTCWNCRRSWRRRRPASASRPCRRRERKCRSGSSDRAFSARCSPPSSACPTLSPRISRPTC